MNNTSQRYSKGVQICQNESIKESQPLQALPPLQALQRLQGLHLLQASQSLQPLKKFTSLSLNRFSSRLETEDFRPSRKMRVKTTPRKIMPRSAKKVPNNAGLKKNKEDLTKKSPSGGKNNVLKNHLRKQRQKLIKQMAKAKAKAGAFYLIGFFIKFQFFAQKIL